jgi:transposase
MESRIWSAVLVQT